MKSLFKLSSCYLAFIGTRLFCPQLLYAQGIHADTSYNKWTHSIVFVHSVYKSKEPPFVKDTLSGTAFLLTDNGKLYLVTAKHLLQADLYGKDQQLASDSVFIRPALSNKDVNISGLSSKDGHKSAVAFTNDEEDIAVISLQKTEYKSIIAYLLTRDKPIPLGLIDTSNHYQADELVAVYGVSDYLMPKKINGKFWRIRGTGVTTYRVGQYDLSAPFFTIKFTNSGMIMPGNNGSAVTTHGRLIGILSNATGIANNRDIIQNPYYTIQTGRVIKAAYIIYCLRKLQLMEDDPAFNN